MDENEIVNPARPAEISPYTRYVIDVGYKGTDFSGWERQENAKNTIQGEVENALQRVLREPVGIYGAGRTDGGVHALNMPAHFDYSKDLLHPSFFVAMNSVLPPSISVNKVYRAAKQNFHARFHATWRSYEYRIVFSKIPVLHNLALFCRQKLSFEGLQASAAIIKEYDSFESFCKRGANVTSFNCSVSVSEWEWRQDVASGAPMLVYKVKARRFLRGMVRTMVGTMMKVARNEITLQQFREILEAKDRNQAGMAVFAGGLFLTGVGYPEGALIPYDPNEL